jgi:nucleotide-binding universal stress UspA family protein
MTASEKSSSTQQASESAALAGAPLTGRTILLAVDDSTASTATIHVAAALADECGVTVQVLNVIDQRAAPIPPPIDIAIGIADAIIGPGVHAEREGHLRERIDATAGKRVDWESRVALGTPASTIIEHAKRADAALIVMGLRQHGRVDRAFHDETTLNVIRRATCPVLAVTAGMTGLPRRILAAIDFSSNSIDAAHIARAIAPRNAHIDLVYLPSSIPYPSDDGEGVVHDLGVKTAFEQLAASLARDGLSIDHVVLRRELGERTADVLLAHAETIGAELIASGCVGRSLVERMLVGSVSTDLVRDGRYSMLIAPFHAHEGA